MTLAVVPIDTSKKKRLNGPGYMSIKIRKFRTNKFDT